MKPNKETYDKLMANLQNKRSELMMPGVYCSNCGETFALYPWSACMPSDRDENNVFYYKTCPLCTKGE